MRRALPTALLLPLLPLLAGCGGASSAPAAQPTTPAPAVSNPAPRPKATSAFQVVTRQDAVMVTSADGNVGCDIESAYARCDLVKRSFALPPAPVDCHSGWGHGIELQAGTKAAFFCAHDSVLGGKQVLAPGHGIKVGFVECDAVNASTVSCHGTTDNHGFRVSRAAYTLA